MLYNGMNARPVMFTPSEMEQRQRALSQLGGPRPMHTGNGVLPAGGGGHVQQPMPAQTMPTSQPVGGGMPIASPPMVLGGSVGGATPSIPAQLQNPVLAPQPVNPFFTRLRRFA